jgi:hypothetical protein
MPGARALQAPVSQDDVRLRGPSGRKVREQRPQLGHEVCELGGPGAGELPQVARRLVPEQFA